MQIFIASSSSLSGLIANSSGRNILGGSGHATSRTFTGGSRALKGEWLDRGKKPAAVEAAGATKPSFPWPRKIAVVVVVDTVEVVEHSQHKKS